MKMRRLGQDFVRVHIVNSGQLQQEEHATRLVLSMLHNPEDWYQNIKRYKFISNKAGPRN